MTLYHSLHKVKLKFYYHHLFVNVQYGMRIPDVAWAAQNAVKNAVENMTGLEVAAVNVNVQGIIFEKEKKEEPQE